MHTTLRRCLLLFVLIVSSQTLSLKHVSAKAEPKKKQTILIMQGDRAGSRFRYIYEPVVTSLLLGFNNSKHNLTVITPPVDKNYVEMQKKNMDSLKRGDIMIWIGIRGKESFLKAVKASHSRSVFAHDKRLFNFKAIRGRGVKVVYYQTEPTEKCDVSHWDVDEMWDFSWFNINRCKNSTNAPLLRHVPLAAYPTQITSQKDDPGALLFFGAPSERPCWNQLKEYMGSQLKADYNSWNDVAYQTILNGHNIFLNLQRSCQPNGPISFENVKLLNAHGLVISQRTDPEDEQEYAGLVDFVYMRDIPEKYHELARMGATARQKLADYRFALFREKFQPIHIFEKAGIYNLLH